MANEFLGDLSAVRQKLDEANAAREAARVEAVAEQARTEQRNRQNQIETAERERRSIEERAARESAYERRVRENAERRTRGALIRDRAAHLLGQVGIDRMIGEPKRGNIYIEISNPVVLGEEAGVEESVTFWLSSEKSGFRKMANTGIAAMMRYTDTATKTQVDGEVFAISKRGPEDHENINAGFVTGHKINPEHATPEEQMDSLELVLERAEDAALLEDDPQF